MGQTYVKPLIEIEQDVYFKGMGHPFTAFCDVGSDVQWKGRAGQECQLIGEGGQILLSIKVPHGLQRTRITLTDASLTVGKMYRLEWIVYDGLLASIFGWKKLIAASIPFKVTSMIDQMKEMMSATVQGTVEANLAVRNAEAVAKKTEADVSIAMMKAQKAQLIDAAHAAEEEANTHIREAGYKRKLNRGLEDEDEYMPLGLHEKQVYRKYFDAIDGDNDGEITAKELQSYMLNDLDIDLTAKELATMMREGDVDSNGTLSFTEFIRVIQAAENFKTTPRWKEVQETILAELKGTTPKKKAAKMAAKKGGKKGGKK